MEIIWVKCRDIVTTPGPHSFQESEFDSMKPAVLEFVGFVVREDENDLVIASQRCEEDRAVRDVMAIPKEIIVDRKKLVFAAMRKEEK